MIISSESEMLHLGRQFAKALSIPAVIELVGDVGAGKTTFTRGLAAGLGIKEAITSPSFTISKRYAFSPLKTSQPSLATSSAELIHYDFYRLDDPGLMAEDLAETISDPSSIVVIEWGGSVSALLPPDHYRLEFTLNPDGSRTVTGNLPSRITCPEKKSNCISKTKENP